MQAPKNNPAQNSHPEENSVQISLIIPCYNSSEEEISRALASVNSQTFRNFEVIVIDDGSLEEYGLLLKKLCAQYHYRLIRTENHGVSAARNTGVRNAKGTYIAFLDADDFLTEDFFERAYLAARETDADYVIGGVTVTDQPEQFRTPARTAIPDQTLFREEKIQKLYPSFIGILSRIYIPGGYINRGMVARLIRADLMKDTLLDEKLRIGEDVIWNLQLLSRCRTVCLVRECWYCYWRNPNSASHRYDPGFIEACEAQLHEIDKIIDKADTSLYTAYVDRVYEHLRMSWYNYLRTEKKQNPPVYRKALRKLYYDKPWTEVGSQRYYHAVDAKRKVILVLYKLHLYYTVLGIKESW